MKKYTNETRAAGVHITEASPIDDRMHIDTEASVSVLENKEPIASAMYDGMVVQFSDTRKTYIWIESSFGLMAVGYTYPEWADDIQGHNYAGKTYNFVLFDFVGKLDIIYDASVPGGLLIPNNKIPYNVLRDKENVRVTMRSNTSGYKDLETPDTVEPVEGGILVTFDPAPIPPQLFKITIS